MLAETPQDDGTFRMDEGPLAPPAWRQLGVIVTDGSQSMTLPLHESGGLEGVPLPDRTKAAAVDTATGNLLRRFAVSRKKAQFEFAYVSFHSSVSNTRGPQDVDSLLATGSFDPTAHGTGGTQIWTGLEAAAQIVERWVRGDDEVPRSAVVMVMTDGQDGGPARTVELANRIRGLENTDLAACFFATKGKAAEGSDLLQRIVSRPDLYSTVFDAEQLRSFFMKSMTLAVQHATNDAEPL
jgi:hypothetical protein